MKLLRALVCVFLVAGFATTAWGQLGLYGSPETLRLQPMQAPVSPQGGAIASSYQTGPALQPVSGPVPVPAWDAPRPFVQTGADMAPAPRLPVAPNDYQPELLRQPAAPAPGPSMTNEMFNDSGAPTACAGGAACNGYNVGDACLTGPCCPWYASVQALIMTRDRPNRLWTTYETGNQPNQIPTDTNFDWRWGGEVRLGRFFCCNQWALEASYWTLDEFNGTASATNPNGVSTTLTVGQVDFGGLPATDWFDHAAEHRLWRTDEFHNIELNVIRNRLIGDCCSPCKLDFTFGARYFRFRERLTFGSLAGGYVWGQDGGADEAYLNDEITNSLIGGQIGFNGEYCLTQHLRVFVTPKFGIYNNHIDNYFQTYLGDGTIGHQTEYPGMTYPVRSDRNVVSFLTQIDVGLDWQISQCWDARIGYRVLAVTSLGLADNQIPQYIVDIPEIAAINHNGSMVLHGAFAGLTYHF